MAGGKETPRQKMIGMMYLVLLALLAMNVSKQIVMAFVTLNNKIETQNKNFGSNNGNMLYTFQQSLATLQADGGNPKEEENIRRWQKKAQSVHDASKRMVNYLIADLAQSMLDLDQQGTWTKEDAMGYYGILDLASKENDYAKKDSYDAPTRMFVDEGKGKEMLDKIAAFRDSLCIMVADIQENDQQYSFDPSKLDIVKKTNEDTAYLALVEEALEAQDVYKEARPYILAIYKTLTIPETLENHGEATDWTIATFDHAPQVAAAAMLTSIKGQILQAEGKALEFFDAMNTVPPFKFDTIEPKAFARSSYVNQGDSLGLEVQIAAYDSKADKKVRIWVDDSTKNPDNMKYYENAKKIQLGKDLGAGIGDHVVYGEIEVLKKGVPEWKTFKFPYKVGAPASAIGNAEMNVMYVGYTNKIQATASGFPEINVTCSGCNSFSKNGEFYNATVSRPGQRVTVNVTGVDDRGKSTQIDSKEFRVLPMPKPRVYVIGVDPFASNIARSVLASGYLRAELIGSPLVITSSVTGGQVTVTVQGVSQTYPMQGNAIPAAAANIIRQLRPGATVMIETRALLGGKPITPSAVAYRVQ